MDVSRGTHGLVQLLAQGQDGAVEVPQLLLTVHHAPAEHESIVAQGLDLQEIIPGGNALQLIPLFSLGYGLIELPRLTR